MGRIGTKRPSPATVISIVALIFAVTGTAVAGVATISVLSKKEKNQTRNIAKSEINKSASGLSVANAVRAQSAGSADNAVRAQTAGRADALGGAAAAKLPVNINAEWNTGGASQADEPLGTFGGLTVTGHCIDQGLDNPELQIRLRNNGGGGTGRAQIAYVETGGVASDSTSLSSVGTSDATLFVESTDEAEGAGVLVYSDSAQVTVIDLRLFVDWFSNDAFCEIAGQATTTTG